MKNMKIMEIVIFLIWTFRQKNIRNSPWSTPPELIFVSFGSQESHLSNDPEIRVKSVGHFKLWIVLGWSPRTTVGDPRAAT